MPISSEDNITLRSVSASVVVYKSVPIAWKSQQQKLRTHSTTHAELVAACHTIDLLKSQGYLHWFHELWDEDPELEGANPDLPLPPVMIDNQSCIAMGKSENGTKATKHMRLRVAKLHDWRAALAYVDSASNLADMLTKPLPALSYLGLFRSPSISDNYSHARFVTHRPSSDSASRNFVHSSYTGSRYSDFTSSGFYPLV